MSRAFDVREDECWPELTPFGWGVRVGKITWTQYGPGVWGDSLTAAERYEKMEALLAAAAAAAVRGQPIYPVYLGSFALLPLVPGV